MIVPIFYTLPGNEEFAPTPAHPGEDAGADIRLFTDPLDYYEDVFTQALSEYRSVFRASKSAAVGSKPFFYIDAQQADPFKEAECLKTVRAAGGFVVLRPGQTKLVDTGFKVVLPPADELPEAFQGFVARLSIVPRSGLAVKHGVTVANSPGIVDAGYRDFVRVGLQNNSKNYHVFTRGARIAQALVDLAVDLSKAEVTTDEGRLSASARDTGGFGSTSL
jgi:dUTP pyrophosphatase